MELDFSFQSVLLYFETLNSNRYNYRRILFFATDYIYPDKKGNSKFDELCDQYGRKSIKMTILFVNFILLSTGQAMIGPMLEFMKTGHLITFLAIKLPFIDEDNVLGFHLNLMIQTTITTFGTIGGLAIEMTSCIINNTIMLCSEIISLDCTELANKLEHGHWPAANIYAEFRNVYAKYQDLDRYILNMSDLYYWRMFSAPFLIAYSVSISIFCQYIVSYRFLLFEASFFVRHQFKESIRLVSAWISMWLWICYSHLFSTDDYLFHGQQCFQCGEFGLHGISLSNCVYSFFSIKRTIECLMRSATYLGIYCRCSIRRILLLF